MLSYEFRELRADDRAFLLEMLRLAIGWRVAPPADGSPLPVAVNRYVFDDLGRPGDGGVVATWDGEGGGEGAGACWWRLLPSSVPGYGFAGADVPELTIAVAPIHRAHGLGGELLDRGLALAAASGLQSISLSVEPGNPARGMYERRGFEVFSDAAGSLTMVRRLAR